jgi:hypothetical protein
VPNSGANGALEMRVLKWEEFAAEYCGRDCEMRKLAN